MKRYIRDFAGFVVMAILMTVATVLALPALGWTQSTGETAVGAGVALGPTIKYWMGWVVDNQALLIAFGLAVAGIVGTVWQRRGKTAATSALDLVTRSAEIAENSRPREVRALKRQVEAASPTLGAAALTALMSSINRARAKQ